MFYELANFLASLETKGGCQGRGEENARLLLKFLDERDCVIVKKEKSDDGE